MTFDNRLGYILSISMCMQSFIKIVLSFRPFSFFQNLELGTASTDVKCHFAISLGYIWQSLCLDHVNSNGCKILSKYTKRFKGYGQFHFFSEFEPLQNLDLSQISFDNLIGYILSVSMCMQNFITIFFKVLERGPFSLFQNLELGKASTDKKNVSSQSLGLDLVYINVYTKFYQIIPLSLRDRAIFTFSEFGTRQNLDRWKMTFHNLLC